MMGLIVSIALVHVILVFRLWDFVFIGSLIRNLRNHLRNSIFLVVVLVFHHEFVLRNQLLIDFFIDFSFFKVFPEEFMLWNLSNFLLTCSTNQTLYCCLGISWSRVLSVPIALRSFGSDCSMDILFSSEPGSQIWNCCPQWRSRWLAFWSRHGFLTPKYQKSSSRSHCLSPSKV
jgi:hypothetical protein